MWLEEGGTLRSLIESGLTREIEERSSRSKFRLPDHSFGGKGLSAEFTGAGWEAIRAAAYQGRGS